MAPPLASQSPNVQHHVAGETHGTNNLKYQAPSSANHTIKSKKDGTERLQSVPTDTQPKPKQEQRRFSHSQMKKITRKSSKPFINWFQRKIAGTVRARRASDPDASPSQRVSGTRSPAFKDKHRRSSVPVPPSPTPGIQRSQKGSRTSRSVHRAGSINASIKRAPISLNGDDDFNSVADGRTIDSLDPRSSSLLESTWSPASVYEADEDASVRPIPPSAPPSPSPSYSSSSYLSDPRTFASNAASTKPTTLLSVDLPGGMAHIAQAPPTPTTPARILPHVRTHSTAHSTGGSITFSALPPTSSPSRPSSVTQGQTAPRGQGPVQAPQHTTHHPRNNPRPSSPPMDDASLLTLASSAFGIPGARIGLSALTMSGRASMADDSISHISHPNGLGDSASRFILDDIDADGEDERLLEGERDVYGDVNASVRALRPRSSRRGSWESEASGWSASLAGGNGTSTGMRDRSLWTNGSYRTGARSADVDSVSVNSGRDGDGDKQTSEVGDKLDSLNISEPISVVRSDTDEGSSITPNLAGTDSEFLSPPTPNSARSTPATKESPTMKDKHLETPKVAPASLLDLPPPLPSPLVGLKSPSPSDRSETHSLATTGVFVSAPSTPLP